ncbi:hypothetical protein [Maribacter hydrothermalis]|uniref:Uncharacterized protein n=1 Tax=Maribacter hydrothermalis TaxID=1836467 RepID=A0A1B7ZET6_9FLAO|nr:hypothetical protein [Maribacter hydrothermalis]APQ17600.1 hypothetical protein BTR34_09780 [Maribacter hydrothermalis]OBR42075.1 hypothetical protein A9200_01410 [Maribacter hydrothermalis]
MNTKNIVAHISLMLMITISYCQTITKNEVISLVENLNNKTANNIHLTFLKDKAELNWYDAKTTLQIKNKLDIAPEIDSTTVKKPIPKAGNRQAGPIYFKYNFEPTTSVETNFRANKYGKVFLTLKFNALDTINIRSRLNDFSCVHRTSDSSPHTVQWSGDIYLSLLLDPEKTANGIHFKVQGITISGKLEREDQQQINTQYSKNLREVLKQAFETFFNESTFENKNNGIVLLKHS